MELFKKKDYGKIAKKFSALLKEGIGIAEIISLARRDFKISNESNHSLNEKDN